MLEDKLENVKKEIRSVIITYPKGVSLHGFLKTYQQLVGVRLPTREFGFTSHADFLNSLEDVVKVQTDRNGDIILSYVSDEKTEHIQKLVVKQRTTKPKAKHAHIRGYQEKVLSNASKTKPFVSAALRRNLFEVLKEFPDGITYNSLLLAYQRVFKRPLNLDFLSQSRVDRLRKLEMAVAELQVKVVDDNERLFYSPLKRKNKVKQQEGSNLSSSQSLPNQNNISTPNIQANGDDSTEIPIIPREIKEDFERVLKLYPDGVLARHFPFLYEKLSGEFFDLADLGFNDFLELADALPEIFICIKPYKDPNEWMVFHTCFAENAEKLKKLNMTLELSKNRFGLSTKTSDKVMLPPDVTLQSYHPPEFPKNVDLSLYIPAFISAATNPGCFWLKLQVDEVECVFRQLEDNLQSFYHSVAADDYRIPLKEVKIGETCVAMHEDHWYRSTVTSPPNSELLVNVYLVDYGSWEKVHCSNLRYLKDSFITLPEQAFKAQLARVKPINNSKTWSKRATVRFLQLCMKSYIMTKVCQQVGDTLSVFLCDTSGDDDVYINDVLVEEYLAEESPENDLDSIGDTRGKNDQTANGCINYCSDMQRVDLGDGLRSNIIIISEVAYITMDDLCHLFWPDKSSEVLKSRLLCRHVEIPTITIFRDKQKELFLKCENNEVSGFHPTVQSVELCPLSQVLKVLNTLGHPSTKIRETILTALKDRNSMNHLLKDKYVNCCDTTANTVRSLEGDMKNLCLYDLKVMHEAVKFKRVLMQKNIRQLPQNDVKRDLLKAETLLEALQERIKDINSICSFYSRYE